jgi:hypothetical protein
VVELFRRTRIWSGGLARKRARELTGHSGIVVSFRYPPLLARGVSLLPGWGRDVIHVGDRYKRLRIASNNPWVIDATPGTYEVWVDGGPIEGYTDLRANVEVRDGHVTLVEVYPPVNVFFGKGKNVRPDGAIEWRVL